MVDPKCGRITDAYRSGCVQVGAFDSLNASTKNFDERISRLESSPREIVVDSSITEEVQTLQSRLVETKSHVIAGLLCVLMSILASVTFSSFMVDDARLVISTGVRDAGEDLRDLRAEIQRYEKQHRQSQDMLREMRSYLETSSSRGEVQVPALRQEFYASEVRRRRQNCSVLFRYVQERGTGNESDETLRAVWGAFCSSEEFREASSLLQQDVSRDREAEGEASYRAPTPTPRQCHAATQDR